MDKAQAQYIVNKIRESTRYYASVIILNSRQDTTRFANSEINQNVSIADTTVSLTLYDGKKEATCSGNVLTSEGLEKLARDTEDILRVVPAGEYEAFKPSRAELPVTEHNYKLSRRYDVKERASVIRENTAKIAAGYSAAGAFTLDSSAVAFGDSEGVFRYNAYEAVRFNTVVTHESGAAGGGNLITFAPKELDFASAFQSAQETARRARNPISADLGAYTVILSPLALGDIISYVAFMLNAKSVDDGVSFAVGKLNERILGENINIRDDVNTAGTQPLFFDYEGNKRQSLTLIENGVLKNLLYCNKTAAKQNLTTTGHAISNKGQGGYPFNLVMDGSGQSLDEIIQSTPKGIYINEFHYTNFVNPRTMQITGLIRNGAFLIENGKLTQPVATMRFTQNMQEGLSQITGLSKEREWVDLFDTAALIPAARMEGFHFTS